MVAFKILSKKDPNYYIKDSKLFDELEDKVETDGLVLFEKEKNEEMFQKLNLDSQIWDCCSNGKNITFFAINDKCNKAKLS